MPPSAVQDPDLPSSVHVECSEAAARWLDKTASYCRPLLLPADADRGGAADAPDIKITKQTVRTLMLESMDLSAEETMKHKSGCDVVEAEIQRTAQSLTGKLSEAAAFLKLSSAIRKATGPKRKASSPLPSARGKAKVHKPAQVEAPAAEPDAREPDAREPDPPERAPVVEDDRLRRLKAKIGDARRALAEIEKIIGEACPVAFT